MSDDVLAFNRSSIRGADTNSLLRMYDLATGVLNKAKSQQDRARIERIVQRIAKELQKRRVTV